MIEDLIDILRKIFLRNVLKGIIIVRAEIDRSDDEPYLILVSLTSLS